MVEKILRRYYGIIYIFNCQSEGSGEAQDAGDSEHYGWEQAKANDEGDSKDGGNRKYL